MCAGEHVCVQKASDLLGQSGVSEEVMDSASDMIALDQPALHCSTGCCQVEEAKEQGEVQPAEVADGTEPAEPDMKDADFVIYKFKVLDCPLQPQPDSVSTHDWTNCPYAHHGEKARRRDPRTHTYVSTACPDFRKGSCKRGDACPFAHGVFECWLHPAKFRTQMCKEGAECTRKTCFFAHSEEELRPVVVEETPKLPPSTSRSQSAAAPSRSGTVSSFNSGSPISVQSSSDSFFAQASPLTMSTDMLSAEASSSSLEGSVGPVHGRNSSPDAKLVAAMANMVNRLNRIQVAPPGSLAGSAMARSMAHSMHSHHQRHPGGSIPASSPMMPLGHAHSMDSSMIGSSLGSQLHLGSAEGLLSPQPTPPYSPAISPQPASRLAVLQQLAANQLVANQLAQQQALQAQLAQLQLGVDGAGLLDSAASLSVQPSPPASFDAGLLSQALAQSGVPPAAAAQLVMVAASAAANHVQQQQAVAAKLTPAALLAAAAGNQSLPGTWQPASDLAATLVAGHNQGAPNQCNWDNFSLQALQGIVQAQRVHAQLAGLRGG